MNKISFTLSLILATLMLASVSSAPQSGDASKAPSSDANKLVYADFQDLQNGRLVSKRGGRTQLNWYAQNPANAPKVKGLEKTDPPAPAPARVTADDTAAAFEYELHIPNDWAGVNLEVFGEPEKDGKLVADDVSGYKFISMRVFVKSAVSTRVEQSMRVELITRGQGYNLESGYPAATFRLTPGFNTYKLKLDSFNQPEWATPMDLKRYVLKKLTSVTVGVFCEKCKLESGTVVIDNIAFEK